MTPMFDAATQAERAQDAALGAWLRARREAAGIPRKPAALVAGLCPKRLERIEAGTGRGASAREIASICHAIGAPERIALSFARGERA